MRQTIYFSILALLSGCAVAPSAEQDQAFAASIPTCSQAKECEVKWAAARRWILNNAGFKIQHIAADFIETYNSPDFASTDPWARVTKEPTNAEGYRILIELGCNNMFGCVPEPSAIRQQFNNFVNASWSGE